jgi:hypothetical protein
MSRYNSDKDLSPEEQQQLLAEARANGYRAGQQAGRDHGYTVGYQKGISGGVLSTADTLVTLRKALQGVWVKSDDTLRPPPEQPDENDAPLKPSATPTPKYKPQRKPKAPDWGKDSTTQALMTAVTKAPHDRVARAALSDHLEENDAHHDPMTLHLLQNHDGPVYVGTHKGKVWAGEHAPLGTKKNTIHPDDQTLLHGPTGTVAIIRGETKNTDDNASEFPVKPEYHYLVHALVPNSGFSGGFSRNILPSHEDSAFRVDNPRSFFNNDIKQAMQVAHRFAFAPRPLPTDTEHKAFRRFLKARENTNSGDVDHDQYAQSPNDKGAKPDHTIQGDSSTGEQTIHATHQPVGADGKGKEFNTNIRVVNNSHATGRIQTTHIGKDHRLEHIGDSNGKGQQVTFAVRDADTGGVRQLQYRINGNNHTVTLSGHRPEYTPENPQTIYHYEPPRGRNRNNAWGGPSASLPDIQPMNNFHEHHAWLPLVNWLSEKLPTNVNGGIDMLDAYSHARAKEDGHPIYSHQFRQESLSPQTVTIHESVNQDPSKHSKYLMLRSYDDGSHMVWPYANPDGGGTQYKIQPGTELASMAEHMRDNHIGSELHPILDAIHDHGRDHVGNDATDSINHWINHVYSVQAQNKSLRRFLKAREMPDLDAAMDRPSVQQIIDSTPHEERGKALRDATHISHQDLKDHLMKVAGKKDLAKKSPNELRSMIVDHHRYAEVNDHAAPATTPAPAPSAKPKRGGKKQQAQADVAPTPKASGVQPFVTHAYHHLEPADSAEIMQLIRGKRASSPGTHGKIVTSLVRKLRGKLPPDIAHSLMNATPQEIKPLINLMQDDAAPVAPKTLAPKPAAPPQKPKQLAPSPDTQYPDVSLEPSGTEEYAPSPVPTKPSRGESYTPPKLQSKIVTRPDGTKIVHAYPHEGSPIEDRLTWAQDHEQDRIPYLYRVGRALVQAGYQPSMGVKMDPPNTEGMTPDQAQTAKQNHDNIRQELMAHQALHDLAGGRLFAERPELYDKVLEATHHPGDDGAENKHGALNADELEHLVKIKMDHVGNLKGKPLDHHLRIKDNDINVMQRKFPNRDFHGLTPEVLQQITPRGEGLPKPRTGKKSLGGFLRRLTGSKQDSAPPAPTPQPDKIASLPTDKKMAMMGALREHLQNHDVDVQAVPLGKQYNMLPGFASAYDKAQGESDPDAAKQMLYDAAGKLVEQHKLPKGKPFDPDATVTHNPAQGSPSGTLGSSIPQQQIKTIANKPPKTLQPPPKMPDSHLDAMDEIMGPIEQHSTKELQDLAYSLGIPDSRSMAHHDLLNAINDHHERLLGLSAPNGTYDPHAIVVHHTAERDRHKDAAAVMQKNQEHWQAIHDQITGDPDHPKNNPETLRHIKNAIRIAKIKSDNHTAEANEHHRIARWLQMGGDE